MTYGFTENLCVECTNNAKTITRDNFRIQQIQDCRVSITVVDEPFTYKVQRYSLNFASSQITDGWQSFFSNSELQYCNFTSCVLKQKGCQAEFTEDIVTIDTEYPFPISARTQVDAGYDERLCFDCSNGDQSVSYDNMRVRQGPSCIGQMLPLESQKTSFEYVYNNKTESRTVFKDYNQFFVNLNEEFCFVDKCQVKTEDCETAYTGGNVTFGSQSDNYPLTVVRNDPVGFELNLCLQCENYMYSTTFKVRFEVEKAHCYISTTTFLEIAFALQVWQKDWVVAYPEYSTWFALEKKFGYDERCEIEYYFMSSDIYCEFNDYDERNDMVGVTTEQDGTKSFFVTPLRYTYMEHIYICAVNTAHRRATRKINYIVCGLEEVSLTDKEQVELYLEAQQYSGDKEVFRFVNQTFDLFEVDYPLCPVVAYGLYEKDGKVYSPYTKEDIKMDKDFNMYVQTSEFYQKNLYLRAYTETKNSFYLPLIVNVTKVNKAPEFDKKIEPYVFTYDWTRNETVIHVIQLPGVVDPDPGDEYFVSARGLNTTFMSFNNISRILVLELADEAVMGAHVVEITVSDQLGAKSTYLLEFSIQEPEEEKEEEKEEKEEDKEEVKEEVKAEEAPVASVSTFKGVDVEQINKALEEQAKEKEEEEEVIEDPKAKFKMDPFGVGTLEFNQPMLNPGSIVQSRYVSIFSFKLISVLDGSSVVGTQRSTSRRELLEEDEYDNTFEDTSESAKLKFNVEIIEHSEMRIKFQVTFENPKQVSHTNFGSDRLELRFINPGAFVSAKTLKPMTKESFEEGKPTIAIELPTIVSNKEEAENIQESVSTGGDFMSAMTTGNLFFNLLIGGSMQQLWGMIRAMQMIVLSALINVNYPPHTVIFFQTSMVFAQMDIFNGEDWYEENLKFKETPPLTPKFEMYGLENMNFFLNSGSFLVLQAFIVIFVIFEWSLNFIAVRFYRWSLFRKMGIWAYSDDYKKSLVIGTTKLFMESYFDLAMCTSMNLLAIYRCEDWADFLENLQGRDNILNFFITFIVAFWIIYFPFVSHNIIKTNYNNLERREVKEKYKIFYEDLRTDNFHAANYNTYFVIRRFWTAFVLVYMELPIFQCMFLLIFSTINLNYEWSTKPQTEMKANRIEVLNELTILLCNYVTLVMLNAAIPIDFTYLLGWVLIGISGMNIFINLCILVQEVIWDSIQSYRANKKINKLTNIIKQKIENRKYLVQREDIQEEVDLSNYQEQVNIFEAIQFCRIWFPHRQWLVANGVDFADMKEEVDYQALLKQFNFIQRARNVKLTKGIDYAVKEMKEQERQQLIRLKLEQTYDSGDKKALAKLKTKKTWMFIRQKKIEKNLNTIQEINESSEQTDQEFTNSDEDRGQILQHKVIEGFSPQDNWFDFSSVLDDKQKLASMIRKAKKEKREIPKLLREKLKSELNNYGMTQEEEQELMNDPDFKLHNPFDIGFLVDSNSEEDSMEEYGVELVDLINQSDQQLFETMLKNPGVVDLKHGNRNFSLQALLQALLEVTNMKQYFVMQKFYPDTTMPATEMKKKVSDLYQQVFQPRIGFLENQKTYDLAIMHDALDSENINYRDHQNCDVLYLQVLRTLDCDLTAKKVEFSDDTHKMLVKQAVAANDDSEKMAHFDEAIQSVIAKEFTILFAQRVMCQYFKIMYTYSTRWSLRVNPLETFQKSVNEYFRRAKHTTYCPMCEDHSRQQLITKMEVRQLPPTLVIATRVFNKETGLREKFCWSIPASFNFGKYVFNDQTEEEKADDERYAQIGREAIELLDFYSGDEDEQDNRAKSTHKGQHIYELFAIIAVDGDDLETSTYYSLVKKNCIDGQQEWIEFSAKKHKVITEEQALNDYTPHYMMFRQVSEPKELPDIEKMQEEREEQVKQMRKEEIKAKKERLQQLRQMKSEKMAALEKVTHLDQHPSLKKQKAQRPKRTKKENAPAEEDQVEEFTLERKAAIIHS